MMITKIKEEWERQDGFDRDYNFLTEENGGYRNGFSKEVALETMKESILEFEDFKLTIQTIDGGIPYARTNGLRNYWITTVYVNDIKEELFWLGRAYPSLEESQIGHDEIVYNLNVLEPSENILKEIQSKLKIRV